MLKRLRSVLALVCFVAALAVLPPAVQAQTRYGVNYAGSYSTGSSLGYSVGDVVGNTVSGNTTLYLSLQYQAAGSVQPLTNSAYWVSFPGAGGVGGAGAWSSILSYSATQLSVYGGCLYYSNAGGNLNNQPSPTSTYWTQIGDCAGAAAAVQASLTAEATTRANADTAIQATVAYSAVNTQSGATYTLAATDCTRLGGVVKFSYAGNVAVTLPTPTGTSGNFPQGCRTYVKNLLGAGLSLTFTPVGSTIDNLASYAIYNPGDVVLVSDGVNWSVFGGSGVRGAGSLTATNGIVDVATPGVAGELAPPTTPGTYVVTETPTVAGTSVPPAFTNLNSSYLQSLLGSGVYDPANAAANVQTNIVAGIQGSSYVSATDTGTANAYALTISPAPTLAVNSSFVFKAANTSTGASTLTVNGVTKNLYRRTNNGPAALGLGDIVQGQEVRVDYDGTAFQLGGTAGKFPTTAIAALYGFGTSYMACVGVPSCAQHYFGLLQTLTPGARADNYGVSSTKMPAIINLELANFSPSFTQPSVTILDGFENDLSTLTTADATGLTTFGQDWVTIPPAFRIMASAASNSGFTADSTLPIETSPNILIAQGTPMKSSTSGSTVTYSIPSSNTSTSLGYFYEVTVGGTGTFTVALDSTPLVSPLSGTTTWSSAPSGPIGGTTATTMEEFRFPMTTGAHTVVVTTTNNAQVDSGGVDWVPPAGTVNSNAVFQLEVVPFAGTYTQFNPIIDSVSAASAAAGLRVYLVRTISGVTYSYGGVSATTAAWNNAVDLGIVANTPQGCGGDAIGHPNCVGSLLFAQDILAEQLASGFIFSSFSPASLTATSQDQLLALSGVKVANDATNLLAPFSLSGNVEGALGNTISYLQSFSHFNRWGLGGGPSGFSLYTSTTNNAGVNFWQDTSTGYPWSGKNLLGFHIPPNTFGVCLETVYTGTQQTSISNASFSNCGSAIDASGNLSARTYASAGPKFTITGCSTSSTTGGASVGTFTLSASGACTGTITGGFVNTGGVNYSAAVPTGLHCTIHDRNQPTLYLGGETASTPGSNSAAATFTFSLPAGVASGDVISFGCLGY